MAESGVTSRLAWLAVFAAGFGYVEAAVVVYLREIYYPGGFAFPLVLPADRILTAEVVREAATLIMLLAAARLAGRSAWGRFGAFCVAFGVWDLVYYAGLWAVLDWPESLLTWDVLFLLPLVWVGPVLSAALVAVSLVGAGVVMWIRADAGFHPRTPWTVWAAAALSLALLLASFMANHGAVRATGMPGAFPWWLWGAGFAIGWAAFAAAFGGGAGGPRAPRKPHRPLVETRF